MTSPPVMQTDYRQKVSTTPETERPRPVGLVELEPATLQHWHQQHQQQQASNGQLPSLGSAAHAAGACRRCCFFAKGRCQNGLNCVFCHMPHERRSRGRGCRGHGSSRRGTAEDMSPPTSVPQTPAPATPFSLATPVSTTSSSATSYRVAPTSPPGLFGPPGLEVHAVARAPRTPAPARSPVLSGSSVPPGLEPPGNFARIAPSAAPKVPMPTAAPPLLPPRSPPREVPEEKSDLPPPPDSSPSGVSVWTAGSLKVIMPQDKSKDAQGANMIATNSTFATRGSLLATHAPPPQPPPRAPGSPQGRAQTTPILGTTPGRVTAGSTAGCQAGAPNLPRLLGSRTTASAAPGCPGLAAAAAAAPKLSALPPPCVTPIRAPPGLEKGLFAPPAKVLMSDYLRLAGGAGHLEPLRVPQWML
mmetsp:Transcript_3038/g.9205  ORF Transcript_3038/g.9205 Transcript_3038/m.9205 type:complete len:416 (-) Transcript_3038:91-1338(-)